MAAGFEIPRERSVRRAILNAAFSYGIATGRTSLERRRVARGRGAEAVVDTFKWLLAILVVPAVIFSMWVAANSRGGVPLRLILFVLFAPLFVLVAALSAWTFTLLSLALIELGHPMRRSWVRRPGHFLTLHELSAEQLRWADIAFREDDQTLTYQSLQVGGTAAASGDGGDSDDRDRAFAALNRSMALSEQVARGLRIWVDD